MRCKRKAAAALSEHHAKPPCNCRLPCLYQDMCSQAPHPPAIGPKVNTHLLTSSDTGLLWLCPDLLQLISCEPCSMRLLHVKGCQKHVMLVAQARTGAGRFECHQPSVALPASCPPRIGAQPRGGLATIPCPASGRWEPALQTLPSCMPSPPTLVRT